MDVTPAPNPSPMAPDPHALADRPLAGFTVGVTADRRRDELISLVERRGARILAAATMRIVPLADDTALREATERCLAGPVDFAVATTGVGWRGWVSAADCWGLGDALRSALSAARVVSRGPKATGAVRATGLREEFSPPSELSEDLRDWLLTQPLAGTRVVVQEHGVSNHALTSALTARGAEVISASPYAWGPSPEPDAVRRLLDALARRELHAITFTSAPAAVALLDTAQSLGVAAEVIAALSDHTITVCIGPVCARPLLERGLTPVWPERGRLGALARLLAEVLPARLGRRLSAGARTVVIQGDLVRVDEREHWLAPLSATLLRVLAERPGEVFSRTELLTRVWPRSAGQEHAVETAVGRLRSSLADDADLVRTVTKRGYRLMADAASP